MIGLLSACQSQCLEFLLFSIIGIPSVALRGGLDAKLSIALMIVIFILLL